MKTHFFSLLIAITTAGVLSASSAVASSTSAVDVKVIAADAQPASCDLPSFKPFRIWCVQHWCFRECPQFNNVRWDCTEHCGPPCVEDLKKGTPCWHMLNNASQKFLAEHARENISSGGKNASTDPELLPKPTYEYAPPKDKTIQEILESTPLLNDIVTSVVMEYMPLQGHSIYCRITDYVSHPVSRGVSRHQCVYNLDTGELTVLENKFHCYKTVGAKKPMVPYLSPIPVAPDGGQANSP